MTAMPNDRQRAALIRIADALMKDEENPEEAGGDRIAYALERIALWCELSAPIWDKIETIGD